MGVSLHGLATRLVQILDEAEVEGPAAILVSLKLGDRRIGRFGRIKFDDSGTARPTTRLVLYFSLLDFPDSSK